MPPPSAPDRGSGDDGERARAEERAAEPELRAQAGITNSRKTVGCVA